ncbi:MAG: hypothetical protein J4G14_04475 [Dehalococcoidia bacterium]|nr:hypothetical protein [Dehalococcoidia bacterium]
MHRDTLRQIEPGDLKWGTPSIRPPDVFVSISRTTAQENVPQPVRRWPGTLIAYDWIVEGRRESLSPEKPFDASAHDSPVIQGVDLVTFEIHSVPVPTSITIMRVFDLETENPSDYDPILEWLALGRSEPEGIDVVSEESADTRLWRLDVPVVPTQEASYLVLQAAWSPVASLDASSQSASWLFRVAGDPQGNTRQERIKTRDLQRTESGTKKPAMGDGGPIAWRQGSDLSRNSERLEAIMLSPVGKAFATVGAKSEMSPESLALPQTTVWLCSAASDEVDVWHSDRNDRLSYLERESPNHFELLRRVMREDGASWWFEPIKRESQIWISHDGSPPDEKTLVVPSEPSDGWERYAQKTKGGLYTSTLVGNTSPMSAAICDGVGDFRPAFGRPPYAVWRMLIDDAARILEIYSAHDWHSLCVEYPAQHDERRPGQVPDFSGDPKQLEPDWSKVAEDWDAVHLSFGGYLTATQVRVESEAGWTYH